MGIVSDMMRASLVGRKPVDALRLWLIEEEGFRLEEYDDSLGFPTIGVGHLIRPGDKFPQGRCTAAQAFAWLEHDLIEAECGFLRLFPANDFDPARQMALMAMVFQMGPGQEGVGGFRQMLRAIDVHDWTKAATEALDSDWAKQTPARAERTAAILLRGMDGLPKI